MPKDGSPRRIPRALTALVAVVAAATVIAAPSGRATVQTQSALVLPVFIARTPAVSPPLYTAIVAVNTSAVAGLPTGGSTTMDLYMMNPDGTPTMGTNAAGPDAICNPCAFDIAAGHRLGIKTVDLLKAKEGFKSKPIVTGYLVLELRGSGLGMTDVDAYLQRGYLADITPLPMNNVPNP